MYCEALGGALAITLNLRHGTEHLRFDYRCAQGPQA
jgi:hypothetical protein